MNSLYNQALRQFSSIQSDLSRLDVDPTQSTALFGSVTVSLQALQRTVDEYESLAKRELIQSKQEKALGRVSKFRNDFTELNNQLVMLKQKAAANTAGNAQEARATSSAYSTGAPNHRLVAVAESPFSLHSRSSSNPYGSHNQDDPLAAYKMNASAAAMFGGGGGGSNGSPFNAREGHALREHSFIQQTEAQLDAFIAQGREVFGNLVEQKNILKGTQRRLLDAANTLGLSRDVIGYIERRSTQDNIIFAIGAIFTLVCFYYIYKWFG